MEVHNSFMEHYFGALLPEKCSHFICFVDEGTSQTGMMDVTCIITKGSCNGSLNFHYLEAFG